MNVVVLDPALENSNAGDEVISGAIRALELPLLSGAERVTTHRVLRRSERKLVGGADLVILGGTNAISSHMERFRQWFIDPDLALRLRRKTVFMGVGWWQYQGSPCLYTKSLLRLISHDRYSHSVRDDYTHRRLTGLGLRATMTGCPTTWLLPECPLPLGKSNRAVVTLTDYSKSPAIDTAWLSRVVSHYDEVDFVAMGPGDAAYLSTLEVGGVRHVGYGVSALDSVIDEADHVGTRLHAGIHAMSKGSASLVLAVDNRAHEMQKSIGLPVVDRADLAGIGSHLTSGRIEAMSIPTDAVTAWTAQFA